MDELENLKRKKREIEAKIKELQNNNVVICGRAKLDKEHYPTSRPDEWGIYINRIFSEDLDRKGGWYSIIRSQNKEWCIEQIQTVINDLQGLLRKIEGKKE